MAAKKKSSPKTPKALAHDLETLPVPDDIYEQVAQALKDKATPASMAELYGSFVTSNGEVLTNGVSFPVNFTIEKPTPKAYAMSAVDYAKLEHKVVGDMAHFYHHAHHNVVYGADYAKGPDSYDQVSSVQYIDQSGIYVDQGTGKEYYLQQGTTVSIVGGGAGFLFKKAVVVAKAPSAYGKYYPKKPAPHYADFYKPPKQAAPEWKDEYMHPGYLNRVWEGSAGTQDVQGAGSDGLVADILGALSDG